MNLPIDMSRIVPALLLAAQCAACAVPPRAPVPAPQPAALEPAIRVEARRIPAGDSRRFTLHLDTIDAPPGDPPSWRVPACHRHLPFRIPHFEVGRTGVSAGVVSPRGDRIALLVSRGDENVVEVVDLATGETVSTLRDAWAPNLQRGMAFSPDGDRFALGTQQGTVLVWLVRTGELEAVLPHRGSPGAAPPSPEEEARRFVQSVAFAPDGRTLASAGGDGTVVVWSLRDRRALWRGEVYNARVTIQAAFSADGATLFASEPQTLYTWSARTGRRTGTVAIPVGSAPLPPDSAEVTASSSVIDFAYGPGREMLAVHGRTTAHRSETYQPVGGSHDWIAIRWMDGGRLRDLGPLIRLDESVGLITASPDGRWVSAIGPGGIHVWEAATGTERFRVPPRVTHPEGYSWNDAAELTPDGRRLITVHNHEQPVIIWDLTGAHCP